jgi:adenylate kinase
MLRREIQDGTAIGRSIETLIARGQLVDDDLVTRALVARLHQRSFRNGFVLDGFPRTIAQASFLDRWLSDRHFEPAQVVYLEIDREEVVLRLASRLECPQCSRTYSLATAPAGVCALDGVPLVNRLDDNIDSIRERFRQYEENTKPLLQYYAKHRLHHINATGSPEEVFIKTMTSIASASSLPQVAVASRGSVLLASSAAG